jgi:ketosteroid isomerase-like protein
VRGHALLRRAQTAHWTPARWGAGVQCAVIREAGSVANRDTARAMSEESATPGLVERVRLMLEAANRADFDMIVQFWVEDAVWVMADEIETFEGVDAIRRHWEEWYGAYEEFSLAPLTIVGLGNGVVFAVARQGGRLGGGSAVLSQDMALVYEWSNDSIVRGSAFFDVEGGRVAAERLAESRG